jgi:DNA-3-methyladenine glycosylase
MIAPPDRTPLPRAFFDRPVLEVAPDLLGRFLVRTTPDGPIVLRLTEIEAYDGPNDPGSHADRGPTARNAVMFGPPDMCTSASPTACQGGQRER